LYYKYYFFIKIKSINIKNIIICVINIIGILNRIIIIIIILNIHLKNIIVCVGNIVGFLNIIICVINIIIFIIIQSINKKILLFMV